MPKAPKKTSKRKGVKRITKKDLDRMRKATEIYAIPLEPFLRRATSIPPEGWVQIIQKLIGRSTVPITRGPFKGHGRTDELKWLTGLVQAVLKQNRKTMKGQIYDGNMLAAASLGMALVLWFLRTQRAKTMDPRRPVNIRKSAYMRWVAYTMELMRIVSDESHDFASYPGQEWENPFREGATDGHFV